MSSLVYLLVWSRPPHIPHISSPSQCLLFATHAHTNGKLKVLKGTQIISPKKWPGLILLSSTIECLTEEGRYDTLYACCLMPVPRCKHQFGTQVIRYQKRHCCLSDAGIRTGELKGLDLMGKLGIGGGMPIWSISQVPRSIRTRILKVYSFLDITCKYGIRDLRKFTSCSSFHVTRSTK